MYIQPTTTNTNTHTLFFIVYKSIFNHVLVIKTNTQNIFFFRNVVPDLDKERP